MKQQALTKLRYSEDAWSLAIQFKDGETIAINLKTFAEEDLRYLARFGLKRMIQNAAAPVKEPDKKVTAMKRKATELAEGKLFSERSRTSRTSRAEIEREVALRAALAMKKAGVPKEVIHEAFPQLSQDDLK